MTDRDEQDNTPVASRRTLLLGAGALGAVGVLAACGTDAPATSGGSNGGSTATAAIKATDIPVGGGKVFPGQNIVVTQPTAGTFKAFSATCTHQGCQVTVVQGGQIGCPCHGSAFHIADGSVATGPAKTALAAKTVTESGGSLTVA